ncbi:hypothetical protein C0J45_3008 [Silurus meridionalis]|nr:hypothetical protein C0J45_3008 [Silurus meridionalis]
MAGVFLWHNFYAPLNHNSEGQTYAAHLCYLLALKELSSSQGSSFELIGYEFDSRYIPGELLDLSCWIRPCRSTQGRWDLPLHTENDNVYQNLHLVSGLSGGCHDLIWWCLEQDPFSRPTFEEILSHEWFMGLPKVIQYKEN